MKVVVTGASGNVGTAVLRALGGDEAVEEVVAVARRLPADGRGGAPAKVRWESLDLGRDDPGPVLAGADAVIHLAWLIQPSRRRDTMDQVNVEGTRRLLEAAAGTSCRRVVVASSVGTYSPGPKEPPVSESWPAGGIRSSTYSVEKAAVESMLDAFEAEGRHSEMSVARLRPALIFQRSAAAEIARLFLGPLVPTRLLRRRYLRLLPAVAGLRVQVVHTDDVADAYRRAVHSDATGAFNIAAGPPVDAPLLARAWGGRTFPVPAGVTRSAADAAWRLHLVPADAGWVDLALQTPLMDVSRARDVLGWEPRHGAIDVVEELLDGWGDGAAGPTPPLAPGRRAGVTTSPAPGE